MKNRVVASLAVAMLSGGASPNALSETVTGVDPPIVPADAHTPWRYVGIAVDPPFPLGCTFGTAWCPTTPAAAAEWTTMDLFGPGAIPPGLTGVCIYESDAGNPTLLDDLVSMGCLAQLDADVMAVTPLAAPQPLEALVWAPLQANFMRQAGALPPAIAPTQPGVRLTIVDTQPTQQLSTPGNALHGFTLAKMAEDLLCTGGPNCAIDIHTQLALAYIDFCRTCTHPNGGFFGTIAELARAVRREVSDWVDDDAGGKHELVLNLSVGWDPRFGRIAPGGAAPVPVRAVQRALQDAACRGVVTIAAAGNRITGPDSTPGPLLPGGWEDRNAPSFEYCRRNVEPNALDPADFPSSPAYRPLVYGASAVSFDDARVEARVLGEPPRAAFGDHAVGEAFIDGASGPTEMQTGTSVGALVVSAAAAAAWHYSDDMPAYKLMANLQKSGNPVGRLAQYCLPPGPAPCTLPVRRIDVCHAVEAACDAKLGAACPPPGTFACVTPPTEPPALPFVQIEALFDDAAVPQVSVRSLTQTTTAPEDCGPSWTLRHDPADTVDDACPHRQYYGIQATPWTDGQPSSQPCPTCSGNFHSPGDLYIEIADEFTGDVSDVTLVCGNLGFRLPDSTLPLSPGARYLVTDIPEACAGALQVAWRVLNPGDDGSVSAITRVLVYAD